MDEEGPEPKHPSHDEERLPETDGLPDIDPEETAVRWAAMESPCSAELSPC